MPRLPRVFVDGAVYHVTCGFGRGEEVFADAEEARRFVALVREVASSDDLTVLAWCLTPGTYHLAVRTGAVPLWRSLRRIQGRFATEHNQRHGNVGPLWQGRYRAQLVTEREWIARLIAYIHFKPVAAELTRSAFSYRLCGHRELLGRSRTPLAGVPAALAYFGRGVEQGTRAYLSALGAVAREAWVAREPGRLPWWAREAKGAKRSGRGARNVPTRAQLSAKRFVRVACQALGVDPLDLAGRTREREIVRVRSLVAVLGVERYGVRVNDLAGELGRPAGTVSRWITQGLRLKVSDAGFAKRLAAAAAALRAKAGGK